MGTPMKPKNKMLKAIFATALISVSAQSAMAADTGVDVFDTWEKERTEQAIYPVLDEYKALREEVVAAYNAPNSVEEVNKVMTKIDIGDNHPTQMLLFYAARNDDTQTIETVLERTDNNRSLITGLMGNMMNFGTVGNDLRYLKRLTGDQEYDGSNLLENAGYVNERGVANFVMKNFKYSADALRKSVEAAMENYHHSFAQTLLKQGRKMNNADMGFTLQLAASRGETQIAKEIVRSYRVSDKDFQSAMFAAVEAQSPETITAMATAYRGTGNSKIDMSEPFEAAMGAKLYDVLPKMLDRFDIKGQSAFDAVSQALDDGQVTVANALILKMDGADDLPYGELLEKVASKGDERTAQGILRRFEVEQSDWVASFDIAMEKEMPQMRQTLLQGAKADKKLDMSSYIEDLAQQGDRASLQQILRKFSIQQEAGVAAMKTAHQRGDTAMVQTLGTAVKQIKPIPQPAPKAVTP